MKEIQISLNIAKNDLERKKAQMTKFLLEKEQVKVSLKLKGREQNHPVRGVDKVKEMVSHLPANKVNGLPKVSGSTVSVVALP